MSATITGYVLVDRTMRPLLASFSGTERDCLQTPGYPGYTDRRIDPESGWRVVRATIRLEETDE